MSNPELVRQLLANRYRLPDQTIVDCLVLAEADIKGRRVQPAELQELLGVGNAPHVSQRLGKLKDRGLLDYVAGVPGRPGYTFRRVGPQ